MTATIAVIGSGAAAFAAALTAAERGAEVTLIERGTLGGTCVNVGCVPSKIALRAAHTRHTLGAHPFAGLPRTGAAADRAALLAQQRQRVEALRQAKYQDVLTATPGVTLLRGQARFLNPHTLAIAGDGGETRLHADRILIATGASPSVPPVAGLAQTPFWTSEAALFSEELPDHLLVLGGSYVGVELAQAFLRLGSRVTLLTRGRLLPRHDPALGEALKAVLEEEGMRVLEGAEAVGVEHSDGRFRLRTPAQLLEGDRLLVATGRRPNTAELALERAGVATADGAVVVDDRLRTSLPHIYAAGDCTDQPQLVYVAAAAGSRAGINMTGGDQGLDLAVLPTVVFTDPQVASVGLDPEAAQRAGMRVESRRLALEQVPRAQVNFDTRGFVQLVAEAGSGRLLGAQILAGEAGEVIQTAALAIAQRLSVDDLAQMLFPYLTLAEGLKLCAQTFRRDVSKLSCCAG